MRCKKNSLTPPKCHLTGVCFNNHYRTENCNNCQLINPLEIADNSKFAKVDNRMSDNRKIPSVTSHGTKSLGQPKADFIVIPAEKFPSILFDWPEFFDS